MKICIYKKSQRISFIDDFYESIFKGLKTKCINFSINDTNKYEDCDVAVFWGKPKYILPDYKIKTDLIKKFHKKKKKVLLLERGFIKREDYFQSRFYNKDKTYTNTNFTDSSRWEKLKTELKPWKSNGKYILLILQVPWDASVQESNHFQWCNNVIQKLRKITDEIIKIRPHPLFLSNKSHGGYSNLKIYVPPNCEIIDSSKINFEESLKYSKCVINYNSTCGCESIIHGVPTVTMNFDSIAYNISMNRISDIKNIKYSARENWAYNLAYNQWSKQEFEKGIPWDYLL